MILHIYNTSRGGNSKYTRDQALSQSSLPSINRVTYTNYYAWITENRGCNSPVQQILFEAGAALDDNRYILEAAQDTTLKNTKELQVTYNIKLGMLALIAKEKNLKKFIKYSYNIVSK
jgi:hypothetical protein